ncbi:MAG: M28 family peptidase [Vicinamibacterales bacterium]
MKRSRRLRLTVVFVVVAGLGIGRFVESRRLDVRLPADPGARHEARLDAERMLLDLRILASDRFGGRATDTPGGTLASQLVATRFTELGLERFGGAYEQPFSFVHRSIRALWWRNRPFTRTFTEARNVVGYVKGTSTPDDFILVSAHFDHLGTFGGQIYHGADDNASGAGALLAMAAYVKTHPPSHSVIFAAFDAEELGLRGSQAFVRLMPIPRERLLLDINVDMIGRSDDGRLFVSGVQANPALRPIVEAAALTSTVPVHLGHDRPMYLTGLIANWTSLSDHSSFHDVGVPFLYFGVEDHADMHEPTDIADRIDAAFYTASAETVLSALLEADRRERQ